MNKKSLILIFILLLNGLLVFSIPEKPKNERLVNDYADFLSQSEVNDLEKKLREYARKTSTQIVIVITNDLEGYDISQYAFEIGEEWGIGQKGKDNGIVIVVKPKASPTSKGEAFMATGYGMEGLIPDAIANRIVDNEMIPRFKRRQNYEAFLAALNIIKGLAKGEFTAEQYYRQTKGPSFSPLIIILMLLFIIIPNLFRARRNMRHSVGGGLPFWMALTLLGSSRSHSGSFSDFSSGSGSFGGFGGFGGGSFGGGGAGGRW